MRHLRTDGASALTRLDLPKETVMLAGVAEDLRHAFGAESGVIRIDLCRIDEAAECRITDNGSADATHSVTPTSWDIFSRPLIPERYVTIQSKWCRRHGSRHDRKFDVANIDLDRQVSRVAGIDRYAIAVGIGQLEIVVTKKLVWSNCIYRYSLFQ